MNTIQSITFRTLAASAILGALAFGFATASSAAAGATPPQVLVKFQDLDVSTSRGAAMLYGRIEEAAEDVCLRMYVSDAAYQRAKHSCLPKVIAEAVAKVDRPALSAVFASHYGVSPPVLLAAVEAR